MAWNRRIRFIVCALLCAAVSIQAGCSCSPAPKKPDGKKDPLAEKEKPKPDFEAERILISPSHADGALQGMKPGHWYSATQRFKANNHDFLKGELEVFASRPGGRLFDIENTNFQLRLTRPAALPKGQGKDFELTYFTPTSRGPIGRISLNSNLRYAGGGIRFPASADAAMRLAPHQNYLVVLANNPDDYKFLKFLETVDPPSDDTMATGKVVLSDYLLTIPETKTRVDLPSNPLAWSSIGYVVWDNFEGGKLTRDQQNALVDWLSWGGQLLVSGPDSMDTLKSSFLGKLLPALPGKTIKLSDESIAELNENWSHDSTGLKVNMRLVTNPAAPLESIELTLQEDGQFIDGTADLIAERRVGRGRIVVTAFRMSAREIANWGSYDNLVNNCLFRRAPRRFTYDVIGPSVDWLYTGLSLSRATNLTDSYTGELVVGENNSNRAPVESLLTTKMRYFARDASDPSPSDGDKSARDLHLDLAGYSYDQQSGVGGWNDRSACASIVHSSLTESGGIEVPDAKFILVALGGYLVVLVPLNWIVFRIMGRVEWAWFAVPLIAIMGTFFVVRMAQLDIGFARSRTELCVLETQPNLQRAHLTRFTGLYTSLSTSYELGFSDSSALALPFGGAGGSDANKSMMTVTLRQGGGKVGEGDDAKRTKVRLQGFSVQSNNTGMIHSEQMFDMGGMISIRELSSGNYELLNNTDYPVREIAVVTRNEDLIMTAWIGDLDAQQKKTFEFDYFDNDKAVDMSQWESNQVTSEEPGEGELKIRTLLQMGLNRSRLNEGDIRMTGWTDQELPGLTIYPRSSQAKFRTVLVSNLQYGKLPRPQPDANALMQVETKYNEPE